MYHNISKWTFSLWICFLLLQASISAQELSENGAVTINADNCCTGQYSELGRGEAQDYTIPTSPFFNGIRFDLRGGDGGKAKAGANCESEGGDGATVTAVFWIGTEPGQLHPGGTIRFIVGKHGDDGSVGGSAYTAGGGGGGTAVLYQAASNQDWIILAVAGGGGGAFQGNVFGICADDQKGQGGRASENGGNGAGDNAGSGGTNGNGGDEGEGGQTDISGGGGGAFSSGNGGGSQGYYNGGNGEILGSYGNTPRIDGSGGFGFGGGGGSFGAAGGGGGYSGGGGGGKFDNGGGGGSYVNHNYVYLSEKNDGGASGGTDHGFITYQFKDYCVTGIDWLEESFGFCNGQSSVALITTHLVNDGCNVLYYYLNGPGPLGTQSNSTGIFPIYYPGGSYTVSLLQIEDGITSWVDYKNITITISDTRPPYMKCKNTSVGLTGSSRLLINFEDLLDNGSTDNCALVSLSPSTNFFNCSDIGEQIVTLTGTDAAGNTATCTSTVTIYDSGGPTPDVSNLPTLTDACSATVTTIPTATDACEGSGFVATTNNPLTYTEPGIHTITWRYEDSQGNVSTQNQTVVINDTSVPVASCPGDITVAADANSCSAIVSYIGSVVDNCESEVDAVTYTGNSSNVPAGDDRLLLVQVCHFGEVSSATYDGNPMALAVRQEANLAGSCEIWYIALGTGPAINASAQISGTGWPNSIQYISFAHVNQTTPFGDIATGKHKNQLQVNTRLKDMIFEGFMRRDGNAIAPNSGQTEVFDNSFNTSSSRCWGGYLVASGGTETVRVNTNNGAHVALVLQAKHVTQFSYSITPGSSFAVGTTPVMVTATDKAGNNSSCSFNVTVNDATPPSISCPNDITVNIQGNCTAVVNYSVSSSDDCSNTLLEQTTGIASGAEFSVGTTVNTFVVTDVTGTSSSCSFQVTVNDVEAPTANCQDKTVQLDANGTASISNNDIDYGSTDNCSIESLTLDNSSFGCADVGVHTLILTATDNYGNSNICQASVTIQDQVVPIALCQDLTVQLDATGNGSISSDQVDGGSNDACGVSSLSLNVTNFGCTDVGPNSIILTAIDNNGNSNTCEATITVQDLIFPIASCNDITIILPDRTTYFLSAAEIDAIAFGSGDNCSWTPAITNGQTSYNCGDKGNDFVVTLTVTDASNNPSTCNATVRIEDPNSVCNDPPVAVCQDITLSVNDNCEASITAGQIDNGSFDPDFDELIYSLDSYGPFGPGTYEVTLTVDDGEYTSSCTANVTLEDDTNPVAVCNNPKITFNGESNIDLDLTGIWNENASSDNCGGVTFVGQDILSVTCDQIGQTIPVLVTIEDDYGNEATCTAQVTVEGLPCNLSVDPAGLGCSAGEISYNPGTRTFSLDSEGCYDPNYYRQNDAHGFIQTELCGDGEITAQITEVSGNGWAGISMRESNDPSARMIQLMVDGVSLTRREVRMSSGALAYAHLFSTQGKIWLKLSRVGDQFSAYHSLDGVNWGAVFITNIPMNSCIQIGLITMNRSSTGTVSGVFENVIISGGSGNNFLAPSDPITNPWDYETVNHVSNDALQIFPNPASEIVNLQLGHFDSNQVQARIYSSLGQMVKQFQWEEANFSTQRIDVSNLPAGTYILEISAGEERVSKKLVIN